MKGLFGLLKRSTPPRGDNDSPDSLLFSTAFADQGVNLAMLVPWEARANEVGAKRLSPARGGNLLQTLWAKDKYMSRLDSACVSRLEHFFDFATVPENRDLIRQGEYGNFMIVLLSGTIAVDRSQPWGERLRLTETRPGNILGEMSLLDSGIRFSVCTSLTECEIAVLSAQALDEMMSADPALAASLIALLARKLSLRLRVVSARLSDNQT
ncbi:MAG: cyclic nucleotide-binding domain-containing protein [Polaromonas sp.]|jgi:CRP/FNR family cyclic AMP-dependent transcriptional regulator|uniref:cyclic nucleotide-binding domain-containing protein n=1 Tax=Polaromonas sp. TaxID=1869339 RepID=UPI0017F6C1A9|nr:cyclic nucleotide-binding domain-containing protein [Polaromonas sp.]NMM09594.1 cyclic nucleotide-binding domain-containing protein [Polaromonas sp.]